MFIANDSNYTFGQFLAIENGDDIKAPVYSKCFTDTEALKGYRFIHDPEETDPEKCVCFSIYNETSSAATATAFKENAVVSDLTSISFRLDTKILDSGKVRDVSYYHVIVPVVNIADDTLKYLVIKMTKEVEIFPENYPYYELVDTFADAEPTSAEAPGGGGGGESDFGILNVLADYTDLPVGEEGEAIVTDFTDLSSAFTPQALLFRTKTFVNTDVGKMAMINVSLDQATQATVDCLFTVYKVDPTSLTIDVTVAPNDPDASTNTTVDFYGLILDNETEQLTAQIYRIKSTNKSAYIKLTPSR